jgi:hypothetical protein
MTLWMKDGTTEDRVGVKYFRLSWDLGGYNSKVHLNTYNIIG